MSLERNASRYGLNNKLLKDSSPLRDITKYVINENMRCDVTCVIATEGLSSLNALLSVAYRD